MSLILEALKKSEAERQLGRAPGLMSPMVRVSKPRGPSPWWGVLGLALAIGGGAAWWLLRERAASDAPVPRVAREAPAASALPAAEPATPPRDDAASVATPPAPAAATSAPALPVAGPLPSDPEFASVERESIPVAAPLEVPPAQAVAPSSPPPATSPPAVPALPPPVASATPAPASPPTVATAPTPTTLLPAEAPPAAIGPGALPTVDATPVAPAVAPPPAEPPLEALPTIAELMPDVREALPALKLTMHVFAADPAARFVLIDGKRLAQGDRLSASLTLTEIRSDGAVLDFGGKRFLVPRP